MHLSEACESGEYVSQSSPAYSVFPIWKADSELLKTEPASLLAALMSLNPLNHAHWISELHLRFSGIFFKALTDLTSTEDII